MFLCSKRVTETGFDSCDSCLKFIEHKNDDGSLLAVDTGERCLGFCEDVDPDDKVYKVQENLFISSQDGAQNMEELRRNNITHILNVGTGIKSAFPEVILKICSQKFSFRLILEFVVIYRSLCVLGLGGGEEQGGSEPPAPHPFLFCPLFFQVPPPPPPLPPHKCACWQPQLKLSLKSS